MNDLFENVHIVGCGGVASYFTVPFIKTFKPKRVFLWDADELEPRNLERQNFIMAEKEPLSVNKADRLAIDTYCATERVCDTEINAVPEYFSDRSSFSADIKPPSLIVVMADNHPARRNAIQYARATYTAEGDVVPVLLAANEYTSSEAYIYFPDQEVTNPINRYPEIETDDSDDPVKGCLENQEIHPQLAAANMCAAAQALHLLVIWFISDSDEDHRAMELSMNKYKSASITMDQLKVLL